MTGPNIPIGNFINDGDTLYKWLGMFWTVLYRDKDFLRACQGSRALLAAQAYLDVLEAAQLLDRKAMPVLHRERWYPLVIKRALQGTGDAAALKLGMAPTPVLGRQTDPVFKNAYTFKLGANAAFADIVTYPLPVVPERVVTCIVDNIAAPRTVLVKDTDFTIQDGTLVLRAADDPFLPDSAFAWDAETGECVLWGCDVLFDRDYVYEHSGYALGFKTASSEHHKAVINGAWDMITSGASPALVHTMLASLCGVPVAKAAETVEAVHVEPGGDQLVITDKEVYRFPPEAVVLVAPGDELVPGQLMDKAITLYAGVSDPASVKVSRGVFGGDSLRYDIPVVTLPKGCLRAETEYGLSVSWEPAPIRYAGDDANGNARLWFPLQGAAADVTAFWADAWAACERAGTAIETCFAGLISDTVVREQGAVWGYVEPLAFFLRNIIGTNTLLVALNTAQLRSGARQQLSPLFVRLMQDTLPAYTRLFLVERRAPLPCTYALPANTDDTQVQKYVSLSVRDEARPGGPGRFRMTFKDRKPVKRWLATCK